MSRRAGILVATAALGVVVFALLPGRGPSAQVRALKADAMAGYVPQGGTLVQTRSQNEGTALGKPVRAELSRMFELTAGGADARLQQARAAAKSAGWTHLTPDFTVAGATAFSAKKRGPAGRTELDVTFYADSTLLGDGVEPPALRVTLRRLAP